MTKLLIVSLVGAICVAIGSAIFWGIGLLAIHLFNIQYTWTLMHGLFCEIVFMVLKGIFSGQSK